MVKLTGERKKSILLLQSRTISICNELLQLKLSNIPKFLRTEIVDIAQAIDGQRKINFFFVFCFVHFFFFFAFFFYR